MINIAIDGPSGVGKSTAAKGCAARLGIIYADTGALYRAIAVYVHESGIDAGDEKAVAVLLENLNIGISYQDGQQHVFTNGVDVTGKLRSEEISALASVVSQYIPVREKLLNIQRELAADNDVVMDGRDIGTVILPEAKVKIFLTAAPGVQAQRRYLELKEKGTLGDAAYETILADILERDHRDSSRAVAPLKPAEDAVVIDSSEMTADEVVDAILDLVKERYPDA